MYQSPFLNEISDFMMARRYSKHENGASVELKGKSKFASY
jgi:hypothetical protein